MEIPALRTTRLTLRGPEAADLGTYRDFYADAEASAFYGGPLEEPQARAKLAGDIGHWAIRGYGMWSVIDQATGRMVGGCGIVWPEGWPRHELSWWIVPAARRNGYAEEASRAAIRWAHDSLGWNEVETHMRDENEAARRLVEKLGGVRIAREIFPDGVERDVYSISLFNQSRSMR